MTQRRNRQTFEDRISHQEIQDVLVDGGYSADWRKGTLKEVLTALVQEQAESPTSERAAMIVEVTEIIEQNQEGEPIAKVVLRTRRD